MSTLRQKYVNIYWCWKALKQRTLNPKCRAYKNYGARGIGVCEDWLRFEPFCEWALKSGWKKGLDLDRINNDGDYCPENCRWVTRQENTNNRRMTIWVTVGEDKKPLSIWSEELGIPHVTILQWLKRHGEQFVEKKLLDAMTNGYKRKRPELNHKKAIIHLESGMTFPSMRKASEHFNISHSTISASIRDGRKTRKGTFKFCETIGGNYKDYV